MYGVNICLHARTTKTITSSFRYSLVYVDCSGRKCNAAGIESILFVLRTFAHHCLLIDTTYFWWFWTFSRDINYSVTHIGFWIIWGIVTQYFIECKSMYIYCVSRAYANTNTSSKKRTQTQQIMHVESSAWIAYNIRIGLFRTALQLPSHPYLYRSAGTRPKWRTRVAVRSRCTAPSSTRWTRARSWSPTAARKRSTSRRPTKWSANRGWPHWSWPRPKQCKSRTMHYAVLCLCCVMCSYSIAAAFVRSGWIHSCDDYFLYNDAICDRLSRCVIPYHSVRWLLYCTIITCD